MTAGPGPWAVSARSRRGCGTTGAAVAAAGRRSSRQGHVSIEVTSLLKSYPDEGHVQIRVTFRSRSRPCQRGPERHVRALYGTPRGIPTPTARAGLGWTVDLDGITRMSRRLGWKDPDEPSTRMKGLGWAVDSDGRTRMGRRLGWNHDRWSGFGGTSLKSRFPLRGLGCCGLSRDSESSRPGADSDRAGPGPGPSRPAQCALCLDSLPILQPPPSAGEESTGPAGYIDLAWSSAARSPGPGTRGMPRAGPRGPSARGRDRAGPESELPRVVPPRSRRHSRFRSGSRRRAPRPAGPSVHQRRPPRAAATPPGWRAAGAFGGGRPGRPASDSAARRPRRAVTAGTCRPGELDCRGWRVAVAWLARCATGGRDTAPAWRAVRLT